MTSSTPGSAPDCGRSRRWDGRRKRKDLARYYPTSLLVTGFDIIFFWVARMMMFGLEFTGEVPFEHVYVTPLVRDAEGKKMSKSKGNVVDPLEFMDTYGTDALRFTLAQLAIQGRDVILSPERLSAARAFANKIWNAARFTMMNLADAPQPLPKVEPSQMSLADRWILDRLNDAIREVTRAIDAYEFNVAAMKVYDFIWHEFCDWYIELSKDALKAGGERQAAARYVIIHGFDQMLRLLHPFMPFVSEEIWQVIRPYIGQCRPRTEPTNREIPNSSRGARAKRCRSARDEPLHRGYRSSEFAARASRTSSGATDSRVHQADDHGRSRTIRDVGRVRKGARQTRKFARAPPSSTKAWWPFHCRGVTSRSNLLRNSILRRRRRSSKRNSMR